MAAAGTGEGAGTLRLIRRQRERAGEESGGKLTLAFETLKPTLVTCFLQQDHNPNSSQVVSLPAD